MFGAQTARIRISSRGVTLLELLVALVIAGIVLSTGLPQWGRWMAERELRDRADALLHTLDRARSEAVKRGSRVIVCPALAGACPGMAAAWDGGWSIVAIPAAGAASIPIAQDVATTQGVTVRGNRPVADYVSYTSLGYARRLDGALQMGTFTVCRPGHKLRKVILANSGRARIDETAEDCP
ncbi:MAG TPA: GspH/FimT family pseudopilin [Casimicrobiaceae bacterium]|nr:GspH/FimT family pseudopilin [Casimicrobiaceae bacterium]